MLYGGGELRQKFSQYFPGGSDSKASPYNVGDPCSIPGSGRSPGDGNGNHSSTLVWKSPWMVEPGRLQSMGSQRVQVENNLNIFSLTKY